MMFHYYFKATALLNWPCAAEFPCENTSVLHRGSTNKSTELRRELGRLWRLQHGHQPNLTLHSFVSSRVWPQGTGLFSQLGSLRSWGGWTSQFAWGLWEKFCRAYAGSHHSSHRNPSCSLGKRGRIPKPQVVKGREKLWGAAERCQQPFHPLNASFSVDYIFHWKKNLTGCYFPQTKS